MLSYSLSLCGVGWAVISSREAQVRPRMKSFQRASSASDLGMREQWVRTAAQALYQRREPAESRWKWLELLPSDLHLVLQGEAEKGKCEFWTLRLTSKNGH